MKHLTPRQVETMTLEEKDRWWLENVYRGDMPQLTLRSALTGMCLAAVLSLVNLYICIMTGWNVGVGIISVILSFGAWKFFASLKIGSEMTILENNAIQSIATAAGYSNGALAASLAAYMAITNKLIPAWQATIWLILLGVLGVLFAFPFKKRFINDEQQPFPEGKACGIVLEGLHSTDQADGVFKTKLMLWGIGIASFWKVLSSELIMKGIWSKLSRIPDYLDDFLYTTLNLKPAILGTQLKDLTIRLESDLVMYAFGGLIGIRIGSSLLLGAVINYMILAPIMIHSGVIQGVGFRAITSWALWGGVAMMTTASLLSFLAKPKMFIEAFTGMFQKKKTSSDVLKNIELPMNVFVIGIPLVGLTTALVGHFFFDFAWWLGIIALPLVFVMTLISVHSTALTAITPSGPVGKITQLAYAVISPGNITTNIMSACMAAETSSSASNLLMDIKPGYMLGAKPRQQAIGHVLGVIVGVLVGVPVFYMMINYDLTNLFSEKIPAPAGVVWKAVAELLTQGFSALHPTIIWAIVIGGLLGIFMESIRLFTRGRFWLSPVAVGLTTTISFHVCLAMFLGSFFFWIMEKIAKDKEKFWHKIFVLNSETLCGGLVAGGALIGIILIILEIRLM